MKKEIEHYPYIDFLKVLCAISVVFLHINAYFFWRKDKGTIFLLSLLIESSLKYVIPVFFMITGATLLNYKERYTTKKYFKRRITKVLFPYIIWSLIGIFISLNNQKIDIFILTKIFIHNPTVEYWFLNILLLVYICIPFISIKKQNINLYRITAIILLIINIIYFLINKENNYLIEALLYTILGYILAKTDYSKQKQIIIYIISIVSLCIIIASKILISKNIFINSFNLPSLLYSIGIFTFFKYHQITNNIINKIKNYTYEIYLIHPQIKIYIKNILLNTNNTILSIIEITIIPIIIIIVCIYITKIMRKIPIIKRIVP